MLLSSVNFVAKPKSGKGGKSKEEKKIAKSKVISETESERPGMCEQCRRQEEDEKAIFKFPSSISSRESHTSSGFVSLESLNSINSEGDRVTIVTGDDHCLTVDQFFYSIGLKDESQTDSTCIFRKKVLETKAVENGHIETVVFVLDCDRDFYLTTTPDRCLELNYCPEQPTADSADERTFLVYFTRLGQMLIQPVQHKNYYLHHIDQVLSVQQLDLNWRCPEEYFFHFNAIPEPVVPRTYRTLCTHVSYSKSEEKENRSQNDSKKNKTAKKELIKDNSFNNKKLNSGKNKKFFSDLFLGCFSVRSQTLAQTEV